MHGVSTIAKSTMARSVAGTPCMAFLHRPGRYWRYNGKDAMHGVSTIAKSTKAILAIQ